MKRQSPNQKGSHARKHQNGLQLLRKLCRDHGTTVDVVRNNKRDPISMRVVVALARIGLVGPYNIGSKVLGSLVNRHHTSILQGAGRLAKFDYRITTPKPEPKPLNEARAINLLRSGKTRNEAREILGCTVSQIREVSVKLKRRRVPLKIAIDSFELARDELEKTIKLLPRDIPLRQRQGLVRAMTHLNDGLTRANAALQSKGMKKTVGRDDP
jgi:hypothetical protein